MSNLSTSTLLCVGKVLSIINKTLDRLNGNFQNGDIYCWLIPFQVLFNYNKTGNVHNVVAHLCNHCCS